MIEGLTALLSHLRFERDGWVSYPRKPMKWWTQGPVIMCREFPSSCLESKFFEKFGNDRYRSSEAVRQIRSVSNSRIEWESTPGANILQMTVAALQQFAKDRDVKIACEITPSGLRFKSSNGLGLDVALTTEGAIFTAFTENYSMKSVMEKSAVDSIASDVSNKVRSYSYSWSSGPLEFEAHGDLFGDMDSMINRFFNGHGGIGHHGSGNDRMDRQGQGDFFLPPRGSHQPPDMRVGSSRNSAVQELEALGVQVIIPTEESKSNKVDWSTLGGYEKVKSQVEESVILGLKHPSLFEKIVSKTRAQSGSNKPKVVLFEGPPGTGKSSTARIIAHETNVPMVHVPLESVVSKWFGESEKQMAKIYKLAREIAKNSGASSVILFIDEIDSLVSSRDIGTPHEASKRILSVMLRQIDGFNSDANGPQCTLICATNRKKDLDEAFLSRVDSSIHFGLPGEESRAKILQLYARHLSEHEVMQLASITEGLSGRNLKDLCQAAERHWAAQFVRGLREGVRDEEIDITPPPVEVYLDAAKEKFSQQISYNIQ